MNKNTVLVVEDDAALSSMLKFMLQRNGFDTMLAQDTAEADKCLEQKLPDVILLDWMLPGMDGMEVLENLLTTPATQNIPVYMMTVRGKMRDVEIALGAGALDYVTKPIDVQELSRKVSRAFTLSDSSANSSNT